jgi:hypothetical protein
MRRRGGRLQELPQGRRGEAAGSSSGEGQVQGGLREEQGGSDLTLQWSGSFLKKGWGTDRRINYSVPARG